MQYTTRLFCFYPVQPASDVYVRGLEPRMVRFDHVSIKMTQGKSWLGYDLTPLRVVHVLSWLNSDFNCCDDSKESKPM